MKFSIFGDIFLKWIGKSLENDGHSVSFNKLAFDSDVVVAQDRRYMYKVYKNLKFIKKSNMKLINYILDIPPRYFGYYYESSVKEYMDKNSPKNIIRTILYDISNRNPILYKKIDKLTPNQKRGIFYNIVSNYFQKTFNKPIGHRVTLLKNYRSYLKKADLNLAISKYSKFLLKKLLKMDTELCYACVNSKLLSKIPKHPIKYDAINISRIVSYKRQQLFVEAAKRLGLKIMIIGRYVNKAIILDCPHYYIKESKKIFEELHSAKFYVDASIFEGFGMTPVEAAFLNKPVIASDTYIHREILGDYPMYFKRDNIEDLVDKMKFVLNGDFKIHKHNVGKIKKRFSIDTAKKKFMNHVESLF